MLAADTPPRASRTARTALLAVGLLLAGGLAFFAGTEAIDQTTGQVHNDQHLDLPAGVDRLVVSLGSGNVRLTGADDGPVAIDASMRSVVAPPGLDLEVVGSTAQVHSNCGDHGLLDLVDLNCHIRLSITVPAGVAVEVRTGSGNIDAVDLRGSFDLRTSSGNIRASGGSGSARMSASSGNVRGTELGTETVDARSSSGNVMVELAVPPRHVDASTSSGNVRVVVPPGRESYDVVAQTSSGDDDVRVRTDPLSDRSIEARSSSGDVSVRYQETP
ncbi:MAG: DUF4097 family beta strand repeat protein [Frankia sp.]|nr:DUF4097 family beta strand repeat protein [Frankia sp.]